MCMRELLKNAMQLTGSDFEDAMLHETATAHDYTIMLIRNLRYVHLMEGSIEDFKQSKS